jgi:hypothetical protein
MSRPQSRLGVRQGAQSYGLFPMNINGTMLMSDAMPKGNDPYKRVEDQIPTSDTRRLSMGMDAPQTSCDVGRYERAHTGRYTPDPGAKKSATADLDTTAISSGRPSCWTPAPDTVDDLQRQVDEVQRRIYEVQQEVLPPRGIGTERKPAFLGPPAYNNRPEAGGMPFVRTIGTPQPDPQKYVMEAKKRGDFDYENANGRAKR